MKKQIEGGISPLFQNNNTDPGERCVRKSSSESCFEATWKSNQTNLTMDMANHYIFSKRKCKGHTQQLFTEGHIYTDNLSQSVYCSCDAIIITQNAKPTSFPEHVKKNIAYGLPNTFFSQNKTSIYHMHRTIRCPYRINFGPIKEIPPLTNRVKTKSMSNKDNTQQDENAPQEEIYNSPPETSLHRSINKRETRSSSHAIQQKNKKGGNSTPIKQAAVSAILKTTGQKRKAPGLSKK